MTRDDFLAQVRALADRLGAELWIVVERHTARVKQIAIAAAAAALRAEVTGAEPSAAADVPEPIRERAPRRCSKCHETGHNARGCGRAALRLVADAAGTELAPEPEAVPEPADTADTAGTDADQDSHTSLAADPEDHTADDDDSDDRAAFTPPGRANRFARIEAAAARRRAEGA